uniref:GIY-YIG domain-containing protein n=1 Tax=Hypomyces aurantius TaxID=29852 RepID=A0A160I947_9HYPO|nr:hypothetical protein [Hypomyces aurantius]ANC62737.1 hypothetical protein [Hypomyces aurantius]
MELFNSKIILSSIPENQVYKSIHQPSILSLIKDNLNKLGGIYAIVNINDGRTYIGSSMNLAKRVIEHITHQHSNIYLQNAIKKYGLENFSVYILELLPASSNLTEEELYTLLIELEQKYLDLFEDKYNINPTAGKSRVGSKHSEASKKLMSEWRKENPSFLNKTHSLDIIEKMRMRMSGSNNPMFGKPVTEDNKKLISELFSKKVYLYDANTLKLINKYDKQMDMTKDLNISSKTIIKYKDSGKVFREKYVITSYELNDEN